MHLLISLIVSHRSFVIWKPFFDHAERYDDENDEQEQVRILRAYRRLVLENKLHGPEDITDFGVLDEERDGEKSEESVTCSSDLVRCIIFILILRNSFLTTLK